MIGYKKKKNSPPFAASGSSLFHQRSALSRGLCYLSVMQICLSKFTKLDTTQTGAPGVPVRHRNKEEGYTPINRLTFRHMEVVQYRYVCILCTHFINYKECRIHEELTIREGSACSWVKEFAVFLLSSLTKLRSFDATCLYLTRELLFWGLNICASHF